MSLVALYTKELCIPSCCRLDYLLPSSTVTKARQYALLATKKLREFKWENFSYSVI